ncbi:hypothetical protein Ciccas_004774, partial [Cichlidogyrus casuarinus]
MTRTRNDFSPTQKCKRPALAACVQSAHYFHGKITRDQAEKLLLARGGLEGMYLLRESAHLNYAISICHKGRIHHYNIELQPDGGYRIPTGLLFPGPIELIEHHSGNLDGFLTLASIPLDRMGKDSYWVMQGLTAGELEEYIRLKAIEMGLKVRCFSLICIIMDRCSRIVKLRVEALSTRKGSFLWAFKRNVCDIRFPTSSWIFQQLILFQGSSIDDALAGPMREHFQYLVLKELHSMQPWYHEYISRKEAERRLHRAGNLDGDFLVRRRKEDHSFVLSLTCYCEAKHYRIEVCLDRLSIEGGQMFPTLMEVRSQHSPKQMSTGGKCCQHQKYHAQLNSDKGRAFDAAAILDTIDARTSTHSSPGPNTHSQHHCCCSSASSSSPGTDHPTIKANPSLPLEPWDRKSLSSTNSDLISFSDWPNVHRLLNTSSAGEAMLPVSMPLNNSVGMPPHTPFTPPTPVVLNNLITPTPTSMLNVSDPLPPPMRPCLTASTDLPAPSPDDR